jgi:hypothetical protein
MVPPYVLPIEDPPEYSISLEQAFQRHAKAAGNTARAIETLP